MVKYNIKHFLFVIIGFFAALYLGISLIQYCLVDKNIIDPFEKITWLKNVSYAITLETILALLFVKFMWKWKIFKWLVQIPCLSGQWTGTLEYDYDGEHQTKKTELTIKQDFFRTIIKLETNESESVSISAHFDIDRDREIKRLFYTYENIPKPEFRDRSPMHYGAVRLNISDDNKKLDGEYWTSRKSVGSISFKRKD